MLAPDGTSFFAELNITDDEDVKYMFNIHSQFNLRTIELYVTFQNPPFTTPHIQPHDTSMYIEPYQTSQHPPTSTDYAPVTHSQQWLPYDQPQNSFHHSQQLSIDLNAPLSQSQSEPWSYDLNEQLPLPESQPWTYGNTPLPQSQPWWSSNAPLPHSQSQPSHPSTSTHVPTHDAPTHDDDDGDDDDEERPDEVPNYPEDLGELSDGDIAEVFDNNNDDNNDDDDDDDDADAYNPPGHIQNLDNALIDQPSQVLLHDNRTLPVNTGIHKGMVFYTKKECVEAIKTWHIKQSRHYSIDKSDTSRYVIKCDKPPCDFFLRAALSKKTDLWGIATIGNSHTCVSAGMSQDHRRLDTDLICSNILPMLRDNLALSVKFIIGHIRDKFNYTITYRKAWNAKNKAIEQIYGNWVQSYRDLPQWLIVMEKWIPGTIIRFETSPTPIQGQVFFERLFWAFKPCIQ
ncbi:hypothetical protein L195_g034687, partial [Trifolium pratense]